MPKGLSLFYYISTNLSFCQWGTAPVLRTVTAHKPSGPLSERHLLFHKQHSVRVASFSTPSGDAREKPGRPRLVFCLSAWCLSGKVSCYCLLVNKSASYVSRHAARSCRASSRTPRHPHRPRHAKIRRQEINCVQVQVFISLAGNQISTSLNPVVFSRSFLWKCVIKSQNSSLIHPGDYNW